MNEIIRSLTARKSVRGYEDRPLDSAHRQAILDAAVQAPTAGNMNLYTILDITDPALKQRLSVTCDNQPFIATAPLLLVFCADYKRWYDLFCSYETDVRKPAAGDLLLANADALIAAQNAVVAAESLGVGSCYIGDIIENYEIHKDILNLPDYVVPACMLCFGYPTKLQTQRPKPPRFNTADLVCENTYTPTTPTQMGEMLTARQGLSPEELVDWVDKFCKRNCDFSVEMSRSAKAMIDDWCKGT